MKKRLLSIVLTLALCLGLLPVTALAVSIDPDELPPATIGEPYSASISAIYGSGSGNYEWELSDATVLEALGLVFGTEEISGIGRVATITGIVDPSATAGKYQFTVEVEDKNNNSLGSSATAQFTIVVAEPVGDYRFLPSSGVAITGSGSGDALPLSVTLPADGTSVEVWKDGNYSTATTFTAQGAAAAFTYLGSEPDHTIELESGAITIGSGTDFDRARVFVKGEAYTVEVSGSNKATIQAGSPNGAVITTSTSGTAWVTVGGYRFSFEAKTGESAIMTVTPGTTDTAVTIEEVASVSLNGDEKTVTESTYTNSDLPALYPLYIEGTQVTSANNKPSSVSGGILPAGVTYDPANKTLTLQNGASLSGQEVITYGDHAAAIYYHGGGDGTSNDTFTIRLDGDSTVTSGNSSTGWASAIEVVGANLRIEGDGSLTATGGYASGGNYGSAGIQVRNGSLTVTGDVEIRAEANGNGQYNTYNHGIAADGNITIDENAEVIAESNGDGIWLEGNNTTITIDENAQAIATGEDCGIGGRAFNTLNIKDSAYVKASGGKAIGTENISTYAGGYNIKTTTDGATTVIQSGDFDPVGFDWANTTYFEMPYTGATYTVTYDRNEATSGTAPVDSNLYPDNVSVTVLGNTGDLTKTGHTFGGWNTKSDGTGTTYQPSSTYIITAHTTFYAVWTAAPVTPPPSPPADDYDEPTYRITVEEADNGEVKSNRQWAYGGTTITLTVTPEEGYALSALTVTDRSGSEIEVTHKGDGTYTFRMPYRDVTVRANFEYDRWNLGYRDCPRDHTCPYWPYTDTDTRAWYHDGVHFCVENGLMVGYGNNIFKPDNSTTRAMITVMLWRLEGSPVVNYLLDFEDVPTEAWYTEAIRWAKSEGVAEGYGNGFFGPDDDVTREQMVTILWRYAKYKGYDVSVGEDTNILSYLDAFDVAEYAIPAMQWACGSGMIVGKETEDGMILDPKGVTTRAQMATMMMRFCAEIAK